MKYLPTYLVFCILLLLFVAGIQNPACGQGYKYRLDMGDSLLTNKTNRILINNFRLYNINNRSLQMGVLINVPSDWRLLGDSSNNEHLFVLRAVDTIIIPLNLVRLHYKKPGWDKVTIKIFQRQIIDTQVYNYYIGTAADSSLTIDIDNAPIAVDGQKETKLPLYVKNTGNIPQEIKAVWYSDALKVKESYTFRLPPGGDTSFRRQIKFSSSAFNHYQRQNVSLQIYGNGKEHPVKYYILSQSRSSVKIHPFAYNVAPIQVFGGFLNVGNNYSFYGGIHGNWIFNKNTDLQFSYQTKQIGTIPGNQFQQNPFSLKFRYKRWTLTGGQAISPTGFQVFGQGLGLTYTLPDKSFFSIQAILHSNNPFYQSDNYSAIAFYKIGQWTSLQHQAIYNTDKKRGTNSYLLNNQFVYEPNKQLQIKVNASLGKEQYRNAGYPNANWGFGGGYSLTYKPSIFIVSSSLTYNNGNMPGYFNALKAHSHSIGAILGKTTYSLFYLNSKLTQNIYRDSFFNSDAFSYNVEQYGINLSSKLSDRLTISTSLGKMKGQALFQGLTSFYSVDANLMWQKKNNSIGLNVRNGIGKNPTDDKTAFANSSTISFRTDFAFATINYNYFPYQNDEFSHRKSTETINSSIGTNFRLLHKKLNVGLFANMFKTLYEDKVNYSVGGSLNYRGKNDFMLNLSGNIPLTNTKGTLIPVENQKSIQLTVSKTFNIPVLWRRNYHDMKVLLFHDLNNNGFMDKPDTVIGKAAMTVKGQNMITNKKGVARLKNISQGDYELSFVNTNAQPLAPVAGPVQRIKAGNQNLTVQIPFKVGKLLQGNIRIDKDSFSRLSFTADGIKVIVLDDEGNTYMALTDEAGNFTFSLPAGKYNVSLNQKTFENSDFKPEINSFDINFSEKDSEYVQFVIKQKRRKVRQAKFD